MSLWSNILGQLDTDLPTFNSLPEGIEILMGYIGDFTEGLNEPEFYLEKRWQEVRDDVTFQENILHVFKDGGTYLRILEGDISSGSWEYSLGGIVLKFAGKHELYERVFLNDDFFILKKHGDYSVRGGDKYFFLAKESLARRREWTDLLEYMYETIYKSNTNYMFLVVIFFVLIVIILFFSIF